MDRIKGLFKKPLDKYTSNFRDKYIPERYNQIELMDYITDEDLDHYISISNRADGKSFNYCHFLLKFSLDYGVGFTFIVRHHTLQVAGQKLFQKIIDTFDHFNPRDFFFMRTDFYILLLYKDKQLGIFTDLNKATDLKYQSNFLQDFPIMIYDEFLALEGDYLPDEWDKLKVIYGSINRKDEIDHIKIPKILYLGNAENFSSPVLANLDLFNILENHPMNESKKYGNIILEFNKNEHSNEQRNLRAFDETKDSLTHGEFNINNHNIATDNDRNRVNKKPNYIYVKLRDNYLRITYNENTYESILSIISYADKYDFNLQIKDNTKDSIFLDESYFDSEYERKYNKDIYLFDNVYSKDTILSSFIDYKTIRINKIIGKFVTINNMDNFDKRKKVHDERYIENTKRSLMKKFLL